MIEYFVEYGIGETPAGFDEEKWRRTGFRGLDFLGIWRYPDSSPERNRKKILHDRLAIESEVGSKLRNVRR
jgi:hypothetical protein